MDRRQVEPAHDDVENTSRAATLGTAGAPAAGVVRLAVMLAAPACGTQQLVVALRFLASAARIEPDCLGCRVWVEESDESTVRYAEEWASEEAMRRRVRSGQFTRLLEVLESAPEAPLVQFDFVAETRGLDYVAEVRDTDGTIGATSAL